MDLERTFTVIDSHTAGHPTRVVMSGIPNLQGNGVKEKRDYFRARHDDLRPKLLHEPRGHAAMVMAVPVASTVADYGLFFVSSYVYLDMCGHATIGYVATLAATGTISVRDGMNITIETPAGIVAVTLDAPQGTLRSVSFRNVPCRMAEQVIDINGAGSRTVQVTLAFGGAWFGIVDASAYNESLTPNNAGLWCSRGSNLKVATNEALDRSHSDKRVGSIMFVKQQPGGGRHLVVLENNKFDRSPCGTGTSARLAQLHALGQIRLGEVYRAENILGVTFDAKIVAVQDDGSVIPEISGMAHMSAFSTIVIEKTDPLHSGFLPA